MTLNPLLDRQFRANPAYQLTVYDRLPEAERERLSSLAETPDFYGVLTGNAHTKAVDPETALLVLTLQTPGPIPTYVRHKFGRQANRAIAELVLDDVLQIAVGDAFASGAQAHATVYAPTGPRAEAHHRLAELAHQALRYAQHLQGFSEARLAQRLYLYNGVPLTAAWHARLPNTAAVEDWLGLNGWMHAWHRTGTQDGGWMSWQHRAAGQDALPYKLYISPQPGVLPDVFRPIVEVLAQHQVPSFKIGKDAPGILRPDKMVAYLPDFDRLAALAEALQTRLPDCPAQGVPFTAPIDPAGLLSWGMDPPAEAQVFSPDLRESWRFWITRQLAAALRSAHTADADVEPWHYALDRLGLEGVDTARWIPQQTIWHP